jgi:peptidoglycan/LPS O-acetylase OafA/YrhL
MKTQRGLIRDIEVLRAAAVLGVIFKHMNGNLLPRTDLAGGLSFISDGGWVGVDLFFAISGFVIARSFLPKAREVVSFGHHRTISYQFWVVRLFRLAPSAWLWLLIILALCLGYNQSGVFGTLETNLYWTLSGVLNFSNYLFVQHFGSNSPGVSFVYWSLSLEEQFYLLFPLVVWLFNRRLAWLFVALALFQLSSVRGLYGMMFRTDAISLGVLLAMLQSRGWMAAPRRLLAGFAGRCLIVLLLSVLFYVASFNQMELPYQVSILALLSAIVVWLCSGERDTLAGSTVIGRIFVWLGQHSYAMYLIHIPAMFFLRESAYRLGLDMGEFSLASAVLALGLIAGLAAANYRWIETPMRRKGKELAGRLSVERPDTH